MLSKKLINKSLTTEKILDSKWLYPQDSVLSCRVRYVIDGYYIVVYNVEKVRVCYLPIQIDNIRIKAVY